MVAMGMADSNAKEMVAVMGNGNCDSNGQWQRGQ
jgi:hypothetical protein